MKKLSMQLLADTVVSRRKAMKITQAQLSKTTGINRGLLSRLECKQSSKVHTFSPANAHFFSASFLAGNGLVVS